MAKPKDTLYTDFSDPELLGYDEESRKKWAEAEAKKARLPQLQAELDYNAAREDFRHFHDKAQELRATIAQINSEVAALEGEAQVLETKRENRGATLKQTGENAQSRGAAGTAIENENLLLRNISQELQGRVAQNTAQAAEAITSADTRGAAERGRAAARAGQAGYSAESGTVSAMADAARTRSDADRQAIEGYRIGRQNLLLGQSEAAAQAAESLTGTINTQTADWEAKSTAAVSDVTGNLLENVQQITGVEGFQGDVRDPRGKGDVYGVKASEEAVDSTLGTWSFAAYLDTLNMLTGKSANKNTWDRMLLEQAGASVNPYAQFSTAISPLTPTAGPSTNLLAAAAGADQIDNVYTLSGTKNTGGLLYA